MKLEKFTLTLMFLESSRSCGGSCSSNLNNVFQYIPIFLIANNNTSVHLRYSLEASTNFLLRDSSNSGGVKKKTAEHYPYYRVLGRMKKEHSNKEKESSTRIGVKAHYELKLF